MSRRLEQVESTLKRALAEVLARRVSDPRIEGLVSITGVKVAPDLSEARISVSVLPEQKQTKTLHGLKAAAGHIHSQLRKHMAIRTVPRLLFTLDESLKKQEAIYRAIEQGLQRSGEDDAPGPDADPTESPGDASTR